MTAMRRREQEIKVFPEIEAVLLRAAFITLALCRNGEPYAVPVSFGYADGRIYFHTGARGLKMDILRANPRVSFTAVVGAAPVRGEGPCKWDMNYQSVIGFGRAVILEDEAAKVEGLRVITAHYAGPGDFDFLPEKVKAATVVRIDPENMTGKQGQTGA